MWDDDEEFGMSLGYRLKQRRIQKRLRRREAGEPSLTSFIAMRAMELALPEIIVSIIMSFVIWKGYIPSTVYSGLVMMGLGLLAYIVYIAITSHQMIWAIRNTKRYLAINLGGYGVVFVISVIARLIGIEVFSWMFLPTKILTLFGFKAWTSLMLTHAIAIIVMFAIMFISKKSDSLHELDEEDEE